MLAQILTVTAPVFVIVALGYFWASWQQPFDTETLTNLVVKLATPCLIFSTLTRLELELSTIGSMAMAAAIGLCVSFLVGSVLLKLSGLPINTYLASLMHPNTGNIGIPLTYMAFGDEGLALGVSYFIVISISQYTIGYGLASGSLSLKRFLQQPLIYSAIISLTVLALELDIPKWIADTTELVSGIVIPALLMVLGFSLAKLKVTDLRIAITMAVTRLLMGVTIGLFVVVATGLEGSAAGVVFLMSTMPIAIFNFVFAMHFNRSPDIVAGVIITSTILVFALLPVLVWIALNIAERKADFGLAF